jgi:hypothetical protein
MIGEECGSRQPFQGEHSPPSGDSFAMHANRHVPRPALRSVRHLPFALGRLRIIVAATLILAALSLTGPAAAQSADAFRTGSPFRSRDEIQIGKALRAGTAVTSGNSEANAIRLATEHPRIPWQVLDGSARPIDRYNPDSKLRLTLGLASPKLAEEEKLFTEQQDQNSPNFHKFLTHKEWIARFAPSVEGEQAVVDWATAHGLTITQRYADRLAVNVEAPAGVIEKAFAVELHHYQLGEEVLFSNDREPVIPAHLATIMPYVGGLNSIQRVHSAHDRAATFGSAAAPEPDYVPGPVFAEGHASQGGGVPESLAPETGDAQSNEIVPETSPTPALTDGLVNVADIYSSNGYDFGALHAVGHCCNPYNLAAGSPPEASIDIVAADGDFSDADFKGFAAANPQLVWNYHHLKVDGGGACCSPETTLDVEWAVATSNSLTTVNNTARVLVYAAPNRYFSTFSDIFNAIANNGDARVISISYGCKEVICSDAISIVYQHSLLVTLATEGYTILAATGDNGTTPDCSNSTGVEFPASDFIVTAVGGTSLFLNSDGTFNSEAAWQGTQSSYACSKNEGGTGGGCSQLFPALSYQNAPNCGPGSRSTPDIALNASGTGQEFFYQGKLQFTGGTSLATPMVAGFVAQENAYLLAMGNVCAGGKAACAPLGLLNVPLYAQGNANAAGKVYAPHNPFYDITTGCNGNYYAALYELQIYCANPGYDNVSGWGSFNALDLAWEINWYLAGNELRPTITFTGPPANNSTWYNTSQTIKFAVGDPGTSAKPALGIAGLTSQWDKGINDSGSKAQQGTGDTFYSGPALPHSTSGYATLGDALGQGCHQLVVDAWDNTGLSSLPKLYGPLCFDDTAPTVTESSAPAPNSSGWNTTPVTVTLTANDPGTHASGIGQTYYTLAANSCAPNATGTCTAYNDTPFTIAKDGLYFVPYFTRDNAKNFSTPALAFVHLDHTPPVSKAVLTGTVYNASVYSSPVTVSLAASDATSGVATTEYSLDFQTAQTYKNAFKVSTLGNHTLSYWSTDVAGNIESSKTVSFTVELATTTTFTAGPNPAVSGQTITLSASVVAPGVEVNSGSVYFLKGLVVLGNVPVVNGSATLKLTTLPYGNTQLIAEYSGSANVLLSTSAPITEDFQQATAIGFSTSPNPSVAGQPVTVKATVGTSPASRAPVTGTVQFTVDGTNTQVALVNGVATLTTSALGVGSNLIDAKYLGSVTYAPAVTLPRTQTVNQGTTATNLIAVANPSQYLQRVQLAANVTSAYGTPSGTVAFLCSGKNMGTVVLSEGIAAFTTNQIPVGTQSITAVYAGNANYAKSTSAAIAEVIKPATTDTLLLSSLNPAPYGKAILLPVNVTNANGGIPTGTVTLKDGAAVVATGTVLNGQASLTLLGASFAPPTVGTHSLTAVYVGSEYFAPSSSAVLVQTVTQGATTTALTSSPNPANTISKVTFTATVARAAGVAPTGTVTFHDGRTTIGTGTLSATGVATFTIATGMTAGTHTVFASYSGDANYLASTSPTISQVVNPLLR